MSTIRIKIEMQHLKQLFTSLLSKKKILTM